MKRLVGAGLLVLAAAVFCCAAYPPVLIEVLPQEVPSIVAQRVFIAKVVSGDTVAVQTKEGAVNCVLYGLHAPGGRWGIKARDYLQWRVEQRYCEIEIVGRDRYNRAMLRLYSGGADIGLSMMALGLAHASYPTDPVFVLTEAAAQKREIGMWGKK